MKKLFVALTCLSLVSCGMLWVYRDLHEFKGMVWKQTDAQNFEVPIKESGIYDVFILFRHVQGFPYPEVALNYNMEGPSTNLSETFIIPVIGENREYLGEAGLDIWDIEYLALPNQKLEAGDYKIKLAHIMNMDELQFVMEVGILIKKPTE